jgi:mono/diheme cytochrome c family protein
MLLGNKEKSVTCRSAILTVLFAGLMHLSTSVVRADGKATGASSTAFRTKCAMCHGPDGAGSEVGKSMNVPDLRSAVVQKRPEAELAQMIADGKGGMPSFKASLNAGQIHDLVAYIRTLGAKK